MCGFVRKPFAGSLHYTGETLEILYQVSSTVARIHIGLFFLLDNLQPIHTDWVAINSPATGSFNWLISKSIPPRDSYIIVVLHAPSNGEAQAPQHANTFPFIVRVPGAACPSGYANRQTGTVATVPER